MQRGTTHIFRIDKMSQAYSKHKDKRIRELYERMKKHREENREQIRQKLREYRKNYKILCNCGAKILSQYY